MYPRHAAFLQALLFKGDTLFGRLKQTPKNGIPRDDGVVIAATGAPPPPPPRRSSIGTHGQAWRSGRKSPPQRTGDGAQAPPLRGCAGVWLHSPLPQARNYSFMTV